MTQSSDRDRVLLGIGTANESEDSLDQTSQLYCKLVPVPSRNLLMGARLREVHASRLKLLRFSLMQRLCAASSTLLAELSGANARWENLQSTLIVLPASQ